MFEVEEWQSISRQEDELVGSLFGEVATNKRGKKEKRKKKKIPSDGSTDTTKSPEQKLVKELGGSDGHPSGKKAKKRKTQEFNGCDRNRKTKKLGAEIDVQSHEGERSVLEGDDRVQSARRDSSGRKRNKIQGNVSGESNVRRGKSENADTSTDSLPDNLTDNKTKKSKSKKKKREKRAVVECAGVFEQVATSCGKNMGKESVEELDLKRATCKKNEPPAVQKRDSSSSKSSFQEKMMRKLESSRFRWINEQLYTKKGDEAMDMFSNDPSLFSIYHHGFKAQVYQWPVNPVDVIIKWLQERPASLVVADFGCGEAAIAQRIPNKVHSFDLVAINEHVTACDMSKVPLPDSCVDVAVFCLSLMGTNLVEYLQEAHRVLKKGGTLKIAEVVSRIEENDAFVSSLLKHGFQCQEIDTSNKMFVLFEFLKSGSAMKSPKASLKGLQLKPCIYKRR